MGTFLILGYNTTAFLLNCLPLNLIRLPKMDASPDIPRETPTPTPTNGSTLQDSKGWDGKLRVDRKAVITNAEILSDPEYSDEDAPPVEQIVADEGKYIFAYCALLLTGVVPDLLEDYEPDSDVCSRCYLTSLPSYADMLL